MRGAPPTLSEEAYSIAMTTEAIYVPCEYLVQYQSDSVWGQLPNLHPELPELTLDAHNGRAEVVTYPTCENHQYTVRAVPNEGWRFTGWSDGSTDTVHTVTVDDDMTLQAWFERIIDTTNYYVYFNFENEDEDTVWTLPAANQYGTWHLGSARSIAGYRGLYALIEEGHEANWHTLYAYTRVFLPAGMYIYHYDSENSDNNVSLALVPDSVDLPNGLIVDGHAGFPENHIDVWGTLNSFDVSDSGFYKLVVKWQWTGTDRDCNIGGVVDNILLEKSDSVVIEPCDNSYWEMMHGSVEGYGTFTYGDSVTLTAIPDRGYHFSDWGDGDTNQVRRFAARVCKKVCAHFDPDTFFVTVDTVGFHGRVVSMCSADYAGGLIDCNESGENVHSVPTYGYVRVEIAPDSGYLFFAWQDGSTDNPRTIRIYAEDWTIKPIMVEENNFISTMVIDFENVDEDSLWVFQNGDYVNRWVIDTAARSNGNRGLYVSNDNGITNNYEDIHSEVFAYRTIYLDSGNYNCSFDWRCYGEFYNLGSAYDYMTFGIWTNDGNAELFNGGNFGGQNEWKRRFCIFNIPQSGNYRLQFIWRSDNTICYPPAAAVDSIVFRKVENLDWVMINATCGENGSVEGGGYQRIGDTVTLRAIPRENFHLRGWENGDTSTVRRFVATAECGYTEYHAEFAPDTFTVTIAPSEMYTATGAGVYVVDSYYGTLPTVTVNITPIPGYVFLQWADGNTEFPRTIVLDRDTVLDPVVVPIDSVYVRQRLLGTGFEDVADDSNWTLLNGSQTNAWVIGMAAQSEGYRGLYISKNGGLSNSYDEYAASNTYAYRTVHLTAGAYLYSYDWRCYAERNYDYLRVMVYSGSTTLVVGEGLPGGGIPIDGGEQLVDRSDWQTKKGTFTVQEDGDYKIVFHWRNDYSVCHNPAAAVDNIRLQRLVPIEDCDYVPPAVDVYRSICVDDSTMFLGTVYHENGSYTVHSDYRTYDDTLYTLHLTVNSPVHEAMTDTACEEYSWNGLAYATSGEYTFPHTDVSGCLQVDTLHLTVNHAVHEATTDVACETYTWNGSAYTVSGDYIYTHIDANGCTQVDTLHLTINNPVHNATTDVACETYAWNGSAYTVSGEYRYTHLDANGCTQVDTLHLTVNHALHEATTDFACETHLWNGTWRTASGLYTYTHPDANGCTQVDTLHLTVNHAVHEATVDTACETHFWNGTWRSESGNYTYTHPDANGCTQVDTLHLTINNPVHVATTEVACVTYLWNGLWRSASGVYTYAHLDMNNCTQVDTLHLTINNPVHAAYTETACETYLWNSVWRSASGDYTYIHPDANGCTQVDTLHLTINNPVHEAYADTACETYTWNGSTYTASGNYTYSHADANGCTQVDTMHLTINNPVHVAYSEAACETYTWNGVSRTTSGVYTYSHADANGCTQVDTLHLTINNPVHAAYTNIECETYTWNGTAYTVSGEYTYSHADANGCNHVDTLHLTINNPVHEVYADTACETYTWNGSDYTASGDYTYGHPDANGCTQIDTMHLTIHMPVHAVYADTACELYTWEGSVYTATGDYTFTLIDSNGCTQVDTLHLTIHNSTAGDTAITGCDSIVWNEIAYIESATVNYTTLNVFGCDSAVTVYLTVNHSVAAEDSLTLDSSQLPYDYQGISITDSGDYTVTLATSEGCDSTVTLHVSVNQTGIAEIGDLQLVVYPNPTEGVVTIETPVVGEIAVEVFDVTGRVVLSSGQRKVDFSMLPSGTYTMRITMPNATAIRKVVRR